MFNFLKKKKKVNIIADRIKALKDKLWLISITGKESGVERRIRFLRSSTGISNEYLIMSLDTYYGERKIAVNNDTLYYGGVNLICNSNENSDWSFNFNFLFYIRLGKKENVSIEFSEGVEMTKEEIDLAILEFEVAIDNMYVKIVEGNKNYKSIVRYLMNGV